MSLQLPGLSIERVLRAMPQAVTTGVVLSARHGARDTVVACSRGAARCGVRPGQTLSEARALQSKLVVFRHDPAADARLLRHVATLCLQWTPDVSFDGQHALALEVERTAARFGGEETLAGRVVAACTALGLTGVVAIAPTPAAAAVLAQSAGGHLRVVTDAAVAAALAPLPVQLLPVEARLIELCVALGVRTIGQLSQLPRAALLDRGAAPLVQALDALSGARMSPRARHVPPVDFRETVDLETPTTSHGTLLFAVKRLFDVAEAVLEAGDHGVAEARVALRLSGTHAPFPLDLRPAAPTRSAGVFVRLMQHALERQVWRAPVEQVTLTFRGTVPLPGEQKQLFDDHGRAEARHGALRLRERLAMRLGHERVLQVSLLPEHRPERAFRWWMHGHVVDNSDAVMPTVPAMARRPLFLIEPPQLVTVATDRHGYPVRMVGGAFKAGSTVRVMRGPERIAAGWWDGRDVDRVCFEVEAAGGARLWLCHDADGTWNLHGEFA